MKHATAFAAMAGTTRPETVVTPSASLRRTPLDGGEASLRSAASLGPDHRRTSRNSKSGRNRCGDQ